MARAAVAALGLERRAETCVNPVRSCQSDHARKAAKHRSTDRKVETLGSASKISLPGPCNHSFIQTTANGLSVSLAASTTAGARAALEEACANTIGMTSALKLGSSRNAF